MPSTDASALPDAQRRWSLAAAITSVTVFGLSIGQAVPVMSLLLEERGTDASLNGLNAGSAFIGVMIGPLLAPRLIRWFGIRNFLIAGFVADIALFLAMKPLDSMGAWFVLRALLGLIGSAIFTSSEAWINQLAGDIGRGRTIGIYAAALSAGFGIGPLLLAITGINGWAPFVANGAITALAIVPLLGVGDASRSFGRERGGSPLVMFMRAPLIVGVVAIFGLYESALMALLPIWGVRSGLDNRMAAAALTAVYGGSILMQMLVGWLSDAVSRVAALRLCGVVGLAGALTLALVPQPLALVFGALFLWGGIAAGIYPVALSMAGDRFRGADLVAVNAAIIMAYGLGALVGPALGGVAMDIRDPQGLLWLFVAAFAALLAATARQAATAGPRLPRGTA
ncbi:MAG TPA: MFS transporter [Acetobacteraceae bacterium]|nr:MFS transporter [Acetobacteraceae bacterium]